MKKVILILALLFAGNLFSQTVPEQYYEAMEEYHNQNYMAAYEKFMALKNDFDIDESFAATAKFYAGECLYFLNEPDGAAGIYEEFTDRFPGSNFHDLALYRLGQIYFEKQMYLTARLKLMNMLTEHPQSEYVYSAKYWIGESFLREGRYMEAEEYLSEAVSGRRKNRLIDYTIYSLGILYEKTGDYTSAVTYYDELLTYYRESDLVPEAQFRIGISYFMLKEYDSAVLELTDPLLNGLSQQKQTEARYVLANSFYRLKDYKNASQIYNEVLENYPRNEQNYDVWYGLAWVNFQLEDYSRAYEIFEHLSRSKVDSIASKSLYWSGEAKRYSGEIDFALGIYQKFLDEYPDDKLAPTVKFKIGVIYYNDGEIPKAERFLIASLGAGDQNSTGNAYTLLGEISLNEKDFKSAGKYFNEALNTEGISGDIKNRALLGMGVTAYFTGDYSNAVKYLDQLQDRDNRFESDKVNFYMAEGYFANKDYSPAVRHFSRVNVDDEEVGASALYGRAYSLFNLKDYPDAAYYFNEFISRFKTDSRALDAKLRLADSYYGTKNFDKASELYNNAYKSNNNSFNNDYAYYQYGQTLFKAGNNSAAISMLETLQGKYPSSRFVDDAQYLKGWINFQMTDYSKAIEEYKVLLDKYPRSAIRPIAYSSIGDAYYNTEKYDSANVYYEKILVQYPRTDYVFDAMNGLQYSCIAGGNPEKAVDLINKYIADYPTSEDGDKILFKKGEIYFNVGEYEKAITGYKELIATYPGSKLVPDAYYWIGKSAQNMGKTENAIYNYNLVVNDYIYTESGISAVAELGGIYTEQKEYDKSIELYNKVIELVPDSKRFAEIMFLRGMAQKENGQMPEAYESFNHVITYYTDNLFADKSKIELGILELERKSYQNAEMLFSEVGTGRKDDLGAKAQYYYGVTLYEQGKITDAITALVRVRSVFPIFDEWYSKSLLKLGDAYVKLKDTKQAREMYRAVARKHNNDELGKEAKEKLNKL